MPITDADFERVDSELKQVVSKVDKHQLEIQELKSDQARNHDLLVKLETGQNQLIVSINSLIESNARDDGYKTGQADGRKSAYKVIGVVGVVLTILIAVAGLTATEAATAKPLSDVKGVTRSGGNED